MTLSRDGVPTGSMPIVVPGDTLRFFAFEDAGGIDEIGFATELNDTFVSQLDQLRFETVPEPSGAILAATGAAVLAALARTRRRPGADATTSARFAAPRVADQTSVRTLDFTSGP